MGKKRATLVRDGLPASIKAWGNPVTHVADDKEYAEMLGYKLMEESRDFAVHPSIGYLANVLEVIEALIGHHGYDRAKLAVVMREKRERDGGFGGRIILDEVL